MNSIDDRYKRLRAKVERQHLNWHPPRYVPPEWPDEVMMEFLRLLDDGKSASYIARYIQKPKGDVIAKAALFGRVLR